jgi:hypothetical protein
MVPRRGGGLWRSGTRTDSRWSDVTRARPLHRLYNPETFDDWRIKVDFVHKREYSPASGLFTRAHAIDSRYGMASRVSYLMSSIRLTDRAPIWYRVATGMKA